MTSKELVKAAISHKSKERVPRLITITKGISDKCKEQLGMDFYDYADNDAVMIFPPWWQWDNLADDWRGDDVPASKASTKGIGNYTAFEAEVINASQKNKYVLVAIYGSHFEKAYFARGIENFLADMAGNQDFAQTLLDNIIRKNLVMLENILNIKEIDGVLLGSDWGSQLDLLFSPETWRKMIKPGEQSEYELIHSFNKDVWIHSCGNILKIIPDLIEMGVDVLNPIQSECMDIQLLQDKFGEQITFWGGISTQKTLPNGSPEDVQDESQRVVKILNKNNGYIFAASQELQDDVPIVNLKALVECSKNLLIEKDK